MLFAYPASAPRNERGIGDLSTIPKHLVSWGKTALYPSHSLIPRYLLQDKNGESCKTKMEKVAIGNSIKLQNPLQA
jgi:hypothetical protein